MRVDRGDSDHGVNGSDENDKYDDDVMMKIMQQHTFFFSLTQTDTLVQILCFRILQ